MIESVQLPVFAAFTLNTTHSTNLNMVHADRGIQAVIGVVLCFSLLSTVAILVPDDRGRGVVRVRSKGRRNPSQVVAVADSNQFGLANEGNSVYVGIKSNQNNVRYGNKASARVSIRCILL